MLEIKNLRVAYEGNSGQDSVKDVVQIDDLQIFPGQSIGLIGESGSGKSSLSLAIMGLLGKNAQVQGQIFWQGREAESSQDLLSISERELNTIRWRQIALAFQNQLDVFNPLMTIGQQILETLEHHLGGELEPRSRFSLTRGRGLSPDQTQEAGSRRNMTARQIVEHYLLEVGLLAAHYDYYPHQLSGGMRQRAILAQALICEPELLIVDEPTSAIDAVNRRNIMDLLARLQRERGFSLLVISHDFDVIAQLSDQVHVIYEGRIVESGPTPVIINSPRHPYSRGLLQSSPHINPYRDLWGIRPGQRDLDSDFACAFVDRCNQVIGVCYKSHPQSQELTYEGANGHFIQCHRGGIIDICQTNNINKSFINKKSKEEVRACQDCSLSIQAGEIVALVGESGSGKSTLASIMAGLLPADSGSLVFDGEVYQNNVLTSHLAGMQLVFQDPFSSINEGLSLYEVVAEPLLIGLRNKIIKLDQLFPEEEGDQEACLRREVARLLTLVQLDSDQASQDLPAYTLSGGQRQRLALARALIMRPRLLLADEISSMLDPSTQANILRLLKELQNQEGFAVLYITHDISIAQKIADKILVMQEGRIVEQGSVLEVMTNPQSEFSRQLINSCRQGSK